MQSPDTCSSEEVGLSLVLLLVTIVEKRRSKTFPYKAAIKHPLRRTPVTYDTHTSWVAGLFPVNGKAKARSLNDATSIVGAFPRQSPKTEEQREFSSTSEQVARLLQASLCWVGVAK